MISILNFLVLKMSIFILSVTGLIAFPEESQSQHVASPITSCVPTWHLNESYCFIQSETVSSCMHIENCYVSLVCCFFPHNVITIFILNDFFFALSYIQFDSNIVYYFFDCIFLIYIFFIVFFSDVLNVFQSIVFTFALFIQSSNPFSWAKFSPVITGRFLFISIHFAFSFSCLFCVFFLPAVLYIDGFFSITSICLK